MSAVTLAELQDLLRRKRQNFHDNGVAQEFLQKSMSFFVDGKEKCWWCVPEKRAVATDMLHIFSIQDQTPPVVNYKGALAEQLTRCTSCISAYYDSKAELRVYYSQIYSPELVNDFMLDIELWDASRIVKSLGRALTSDSAAGVIVLFDVLCSSANLLYHGDVAAATYRYIISRLETGGALKIGTRLLPGVLTLGVCDNARVQRWALESLKHANSKIAPISFEPVIEIFAGLLNSLARQANPRGAASPLALSTDPLPRLDKVTFSFAGSPSVWHGLRIVLGKLSDQVKQEMVRRLDGFPAIALRLLTGIVGSEFVDALRASSEIIDAADRQMVWPKVSQAQGGLKPTEFVRLVLNHSAVRSYLHGNVDLPAQLGGDALKELNRKLKPVLDWVTPFIGSLSLPGDAPAVVALLDGLFYSIRSDPRVPLDHSALAVHIGIALIAHCFKLPTVEKTLKDGSFVLGEFLVRNLNTFLDIVQGRDSLSESELLISGTENLIDTMLREELSDALQGISTMYETAQDLRASGLSRTRSDDAIDDDPPVLIRFPSLWIAVLNDPQNTNIVKEALSATSYLMMFDPLPDDLLRLLPESWRTAYSRFENFRSEIRNMLKQFLEVVAGTLDGVDAQARVEFEHDIFDSQVRLLVSPAKSLHSECLHILKGVSADSVEDGLDDPLAALSDIEMDMACYELLKRHSSRLLHSLTEVTNNCKFLVNNSRPAYTCSTTAALLARSTVLAVTDLADSESTEAMAGLFFAFCDLLGAILKVSLENSTRVGQRGIYTGAVAVVFQTVYTMLNTMECSDFVRMVRGSSLLSENEAFHKLSACVSEMLNYLESSDEPEVLAGIVKTFGLIANGLAISPGIKILCPKDTVQALANGAKGYLSADLRQLFLTITSMPVWEKRAYANSKTKPVQIIFDDEEALAAADDFDLSDILGSDIEIIESGTTGLPGSSVQLATSKLKSTATAPLARASSTQNAPTSSAPNALPAAPARTVTAAAPPPASHTTNFRSNRTIRIDDDDDDDVVEVQFSHQDTADSLRKRQTSIDGWLTRGTKQAALPVPMPLRSSKPAASTAPSKGKKTGMQGLLNQMRSSYVPERVGVTQGASVPKQVVKAPRSMSTVPVNSWASGRFEDPYAPTAGESTIYARDVSKLALEELEREKRAKSKQQLSATGGGNGLPGSHNTSDESDSSSSDDDENNDGSLSGGAKAGSGLAELMKIRAHSATRPAPKRTMQVVLRTGEVVSGAARNRLGVKAGLFLNQEARDRAQAKQREKMRLTPNMSRLHKHLLGWGYEDTGNMPPDISASRLARIPDWFEHYEHYFSALAPLFLLESWAQFQRAKEETVNEESGEAVLRSRMSVDDFQELTFDMSLADVQSISDSDIVILAESMSREKRIVQGMPRVGAVASFSAGSSGDKAASGACKRYANRQTFLAMVKSRAFGRDKATVIMRVYFEGARIAVLLNKLVLNSTWEFNKLYSLTPMNREYAALMSLPYLDETLVKEILNPQTLARKAIGRSEVLRCMKAHALNQPQAEAVVSAIKRQRGFSLIQGPPGTGKTKTILGLAGALLSLARRGRAETLRERDESTDATESAGLKRANKLLICAPSNAAVDEIVKRLKSGIRDEAGNTFFPSVVRVGQADNISSTVRDTTLDFLVEKALNAYGGDSETSRVAGDKSISDSQSQLLLGVTGRTRRDGKVGAQASAAKDEQRTAMDSQRTLRRQLDEVNAEIRELELRMQSTDPSDTAAMRGLRDQFRQCNEQKRSTMQKLNLERSRMREATEKVDATKRKIRLQILQTADILSCTLSGSGHDIMTSLGCTFDTVIIDEAAQSVELACLIPLKYGCERCILVGDPNQLPPTVLSQPAMQYMYNQSMFVRIQKNSPSLVSLLSIQYRMHPEISAFPSKLFYESRLKDGPDMDKKQAAPWHKNPNYPPFTFFNIYSGREQTDGLHSVYNAAEVDAAAQLVFSLCSDFPSLSWKQKIGIITPYKRQLRMLTTKFKLIFGPSIIEAIEFNTVDGFQGQEKEVIIFSCVRAGGSGVGFLSDERRMNVGLTRARKSLFVLGNADSLASSPLWRQMTDDARSRRLLKDSTMPLFGRQVRNGSKLDCLLGDAANTMDKGTDGEGSRDLFTMEPIDDEALSRFNKAIENIKVGDCGPGADVPESGDKRMYAAPEGDNGAELAMMYDTLPDKTAGKRNSSRDESHRKRPRQSQSPAASRSSSKPANGASQSTTLPDSLDSKRLNPELQHGDSSRSTSLRPPLPTASVPSGQDRQVQLHAEREKQRSSLFIPRKRGPRTSSREPSGEHSRVSSSVQEPTTPVEMRPPPPPPSVPPPPPPAEYSPPPLKNAATSRPPPRSTAISLPSTVAHRPTQPRPENNSHRQRCGGTDSRSGDRHSATSASTLPKKRRAGLFRPPIGGDSSSRGRQGRNDRARDDDREEMISGMLRHRRSK